MWCCKAEFLQDVSFVEGKLIPSNFDDAGKKLDDIKGKILVD